jgi:pimeloyl-ACP methyl ester carboxylesterase
MRKCIEVVAQGLRLRGTVHLPAPGLDESSEFAGLGVVILHPGFLPRSGQGDFAVALGDALALKGVTTVRIDMPGLGDSEGDLPGDSFAFIDDAQEGRFADVAYECVERIKEQLGLKRVVVGGHCGGAITAFYAMAGRKHNWEGLIALDVIFYLVRPVNAPVRNADGVVVQEPGGVRREVLRNELRLALLNSPIGGMLQKTAQRARGILKRNKPEPTVVTTAPATPAAPTTPVPAGSQQLPAEANFNLIKSIEKVLRSELPILFITADDPTKPTHFDYTEYLLAAYTGRAVHSRISGTDHGFVSGNGKPRVIETVSEWLTREFGAETKRIAQSASARTAR